MRCSSCRAVVDVDVIFVAVVVNVLVGCEAVFLRQKVTLSLKVLPTILKSVSLGLKVFISGRILQNDTQPLQYCITDSFCFFQEFYAVSGCL